MTITLDIKPEVEAELAAQAAAKGLDVKTYAVNLLEEAARPSQRNKREETLSDFFLNSPLAGSGLHLERNKDTGRDIEL